jgi:peptidoglycan hydrolase CwlO-like protein
MSFNRTELLTLIRVKIPGIKTEDIKKVLPFIDAVSKIIDHRDAEIDKLSDEIVSLKFEISDLEYNS